MKVLLATPTFQAKSEYFVQKHIAFLQPFMAALFTFDKPFPGAPPWVVFGDRDKCKVIHIADWIFRKKRASNCLLRIRFVEALRMYRPDVVLFEFGQTASLLYDVCLNERIPYCIHFHGADITLKRVLAHIQLLENAVRGAQEIIANSLYIAGRIEKTFPGIVPKLKYMSTYIPASPAEYSRVGVFRICHLGRLVEKKGPLETIKAFELVHVSCPDAELHIIGDGVLRSEAESYVMSHGIDKVTFHGALNHDEAMNILQGCHVLTQHSRMSTSGDCEGFGVSLIEAMALGKPVVSTNHGPIPELVIPAVTGILVEEGDWRGQASALRSLCHNRTLAERLGKAGYAYAKKMFSEEREASDLLSILKSCCIMPCS